MRVGSINSFGYQNTSADPFAMILVPLERGGLCRHFELLSVEIHRRSSEKSSLEVGQVVIFWTFRWVRRKMSTKGGMKKKHSYITPLVPGDLATRGGG